MNTRGGRTTPIVWSGPRNKKPRLGIRLGSSFEAFTYYISSKHKTPPYNWTDNIFNKHLPVSGNYKLGDSNCGNNKTGRGYYANPCGYWDNTKGHINSGTHIKNISLTGSLFPTNYGNHVIVPPNDIVVHPYTRIGEEYRSR